MSSALFQLARLIGESGMLDTLVWYPLSEDVEVEVEVEAVLVRLDDTDMDDLRG